MARELDNLRREAERLRRKVGAPLQREQLAQLDRSAVVFIIQDARAQIRAKVSMDEFTSTFWPL